MLTYNSIHQLHDACQKHLIFSCHPLKQLIITSIINHKMVVSRSNILTNVNWHQKTLRAENRVMNFAFVDAPHLYHINCKIEVGGSYKIWNIFVALKLSHFWHFHLTFSAVNISSSHFSTFSSIIWIGITSDIARGGNFTKWPQSPGQIQSIS